jgi:hypothetical protein
MEHINMENKFNKALRLLDQGQTERAVHILEEIIIEARKEMDNLFFIRANCVLGELFFSIGRIAEAKNCLTEVINTPYENDVIDYEKAIARDILNKLE